MIEQSFVCLEYRGYTRQCVVAGYRYRGHLPLSLLSFFSNRSSTPWFLSQVFAAIPLSNIGRNYFFDNSRIIKRNRQSKNMPRCRQKFIKRPGGFHILLLIAIYRCAVFRQPFTIVVSPHTRHWFLFRTDSPIHLSCRFENNPCHRWHLHMPCGNCFQGSQR